MKASIKLYFLCHLSLYLFTCSKDECTHELNLIICTTSSEPCKPTGTIEIKGCIPFNSKFKLNDNNFQSVHLFTNIYPGHHDLTVQQECNYKTTYNIEVKISKAGVLFNQLSDILNKHCSKCHSNFNPQAGIDLTNTCHILYHWERIKARAIESNPSSMPPIGLIEKSDIQIISDWIRLGHSYHL